MSVQDLYNTLLIGHYKSPARRCVPETYTHTGTGHNHTCGDEITLFFTIEGGLIISALYTGKGCMICQASASMLTAAVEGSAVDEARRTIGHLYALLDGRAEPAKNDPDYAALTSIRDFPTRMKCAKLAWETAEKILGN
ncbi:MAG: SUF system NifU family Fe-S cluster assembly protein [Rhodothermaceae bacterium]|nr:SUF system NifU family Fe-S cluster assembly protein [Rhodothermaceae bacterium]